MALIIKNWAKFQHFKDRKPPWIKLYRDLLDDIKWHELDAEAAKVLVMLWLIASESDGILPPAKELSFRLRMSLKSVNACISKLSHWLRQDDINAISDISAISEGYQEARLETETETERESKRFDAVASLVSLGVDPQVTADWLKARKAKNLPLTATALKGVIAEAGKAGVTLPKAIEIAANEGWAGFKADWLLKRTVAPPAFDPCRGAI